MPKLATILALEGNALHNSVVEFLGARVNVVHSIDDLMAANSDDIHSVILFSDYDLEIIGQPSGYGIADTLRRGSEIAIDKVILLSNELGIGEREKASYAGIDEVLVMPFDPQELMALL